MSPLLRDLIKQEPSLNRIDMVVQWTEQVLRLLHPHGVVIGGIYKHFKGDRYRVRNVVRDANNWEGEPLVEYVQVDNVEHEATRPLSEFLGDVDREDYHGPRFTWLK